MKNVLVGLAVVIAVCFFLHHPKADWQGQLAAGDPIQSSDHLPSPWLYHDFLITPRARYHIKAVVLSKYNYWWDIETEDDISKYDLALGWGPMSDAHVINQLNITQGFRWYNYRWNNIPPIDPSGIISHSSNHHIIAADKNVLDSVANFKLHDVIDLQGYLVDVQSIKKNWTWHTSLSRLDTGGGACKVFWVTSAYSFQ